MWTKLKQSLSKTSSRVREGLSTLFSGSSLSPEQQDEIADILLMADMGAPVVDNLMRRIKSFKGSEIEFRQQLAQHLTELLSPYEKPLIPAPVVLVVGVNGSGKTTTLGKLAGLWHTQGHRVHLIAGDTFRVAAVEQLSLWAKGLKVTCTQSKDPASAVFQGLTQAKEEGDSVVLIDTAGRLPNKVGLMDELKKVYNVIQKLRPQERCEVILILDATLGQHALSQVEIFKKAIPLTGIIMNKMDGTAKGGILVNVALNHHLPIYGIGVGEQASDLVPFHAHTYAQGLMDL
jgi:fused signal recognition particle receptor